MSARVSVVGIAEADARPGHGKSPVGLMADATRLALIDAGLQKNDIDGVFTASSYYAMPASTLSEYMGLSPTFADTTNLGGASFVAHLQHAAAAISAGQCTTALIAFGSTQRTDGRDNVRAMETPYLENPYGLAQPISQFAMIARRHMHEFGTTSAELAEVAVAAREWARLTPDAPRHDPLSIADVLSSPLLSDPLHKLDCCLVTDGGAAVILTSPSRARDLRHRPVDVLAVSQSLDHRQLVGMRDLTTTSAAVSSRAAFREAGITPADVDTAHVYDAFTIGVIILLEDLGFCPKGAGGDFVRNGGIAPGGTLPVNTNGGGLSYLHPGMLSLFLITEAVRQLRGSAGQRQIPNAHLSLVHGMGGVLAAHATAILSNR